MNVSTTAARAKLSELVRRAKAGEEIVLTRRGKAVTRLLPPPVKEDLLPRIGALKGKFVSPMILTPSALNGPSIRDDG
ncbi:type II toxin-antitoxin system prevent-host-death family antitoxin [Mesorhizobium sp. B2-3-11]|uniref:type II toxin-antitoxin system Phd/YefM family antitoxin n=1 Tax=Mesorhizobium sp. B2-3-11 TaxID=2589953 RepID=UPI0032B14840